jgi:hypothetical protein
LSIESYDIWDRSHVTYHCIFTLQSPLSHIGENLKSSNITVLKQQKRKCIDGQVRSHFVYSANAFRNAIFRRKGFAYTLEGLGISLDPMAHHTLFAGGRIDGSTACNLELDANFRKWLVGLSVLGTAKPAGMAGEKGAQTIPGRLAVGDAVLVCYETVDYLYQQAKGLIPHECFEAVDRIMQAKAALSTDIFAQPSVEAIAAYNLALEECLPIIKRVLKPSAAAISTDRFYRRDSLTDTSLQKFLKPAIQEGQLSLLGESKPKKKEDDGDDNRFMGDDHLIEAGSQLYSRMDLHGTKIEEGFLCAALLEFAKNPYIGGKSNRGKGHVTLKIVYCDRSRSETGCLLDIGTDYQAISDRAQDRYDRYNAHLQEFRQHLEQAKDSMPNFLLGSKHIYSEKSV